MAFACSIFILLLVYRHFSYGDFETNRDKLFKMYSYQVAANGEEKATSMPYPLTPALKDENIGIVKATSIKNSGKLVRYKDKTLDMSTTMVNSDFLSMFSFPVVKGNAVNPLSDADKAVLTQTSAGKLFGKEDPVGKSIEVKLNANWYRLTVAAVVQDPPPNSSIKFALLARTELDPDYTNMRTAWNSRDQPLYVQIANNTTQQQVESRLRSLVKKYRPDDAAASKRNGFIADKNGDYHSLHLLPLTEALDVRLVTLYSKVLPPPA